MWLYVLKASLTPGKNFKCLSLSLESATAVFSLCVRLSVCQRTSALVCAVVFIDRIQLVAGYVWITTNAIGCLVLLYTTFKLKFDYISAAEFDQSLK